MSNSWRPKGWQTLKAKHHPLHCFAPDDCVGQSFEAGADALLQALLDSGVITISEMEALKEKQYAKSKDS